MKKLLLIPLTLVLILGLWLSGCSSSPSPAPQTSAPAQTTAAPPATSKPAAATSAAPATSAPPASSSAAPSGAPLKIGAIMSLTGESAVTGPPQKMALQYRLDLLGNQVAGRPIQLVIDDDASSPSTVVDMVKKQLFLDKVDVILGPTGGPVATAAGNMMKTASPSVPIFIVMPKSAIVLQNSTGNNVYLTMGTDIATGYYLGLYAADKLKYKTTTTLHEDMVSGQQKILDGFIPAFQKQGGSAIQQQPVKSGTVDFSPYIAAIKPADSVTFWFTPGLTARFVAQYYAAGKSMPLLLPDGSVLFPQTMTQIGDKTLGIVATINYCTTIDTKLNTDYVSAYQKKNGTVPTTQAAAIDQALLIALEAIKNTKGDTTPAVLNDAIHKVKLDTPVGSVSYNPQGMGIGDQYIVQSVKLTDRIDWKVLDEYKQTLLDVPGGSMPPSK
jgi:branched-chain amino acid transport system substrate-binding protein